MSVSGDQHFAWNSLLDDLLHFGFASIPQSLDVIAEGFDEVRTGPSCTAGFHLYQVFVTMRAFCLAGELSTRWVMYCRGRCPGYPCRGQVEVRIALYILREKSA